MIAQKKAFRDCEYASHTIYRTVETKNNSISIAHSIGCYCFEQNARVQKSICVWIDPWTSCSKHKKHSEWCLCTRNLLRLVALPAPMLPIQLHFNANCNFSKCLLIVSALYNVGDMRFFSHLAWRNQKSIRIGSDLIAFRCVVEMKKKTFIWDFDSLAHHHVRTFYWMSRSIDRAHTRHNTLLVGDCHFMTDSIRMVIQIDRKGLW